ncbi:MAG: dihydropteroate synthase [Ilumatobacteraceae bacterium]|nr:dihydropteroate synthase [Ilumatobacteraceae bacterium]
MPELVTRGRTLQVDHPLIMAVINATPDSFSDAGEYATLEARMQRAREVVAAGADILDVGGQSAITGVPEISEAEEIDRISPVIEWIAANTSVLISVDTYRPLVAQAALKCGAHIINDISGLLYEEVARIVASHDAGYILMHNRGRPKVRLTDANLYDDVTQDVLSFFKEKLVALQGLGVEQQHVILDPGPDFSKTPSQTVEVLRALGQITDLGRPVLLPVSRKDFIGAITGKPPRQRLSGTLAAIAHSLTITRSGIYRVHDIGEVRDFLDVWDVLNNHSQIDADALLDRSLWRS